MKELVSVIIPVPDPNLSPIQERILHHCLETLEKYPVIFITFEGADLNIIREHKEDIDVIYFPKEYFASRQTLAKLFLMEDFYDRFSWADFLLIHELNSWVVKDELHYWCKQGYDYLKAAPVTEKGNTNLKLNPLSRILGLNKVEKELLGTAFNENGIYLCFIERMIKTLQAKKKNAYEYRHNDELINRDSVFWELEANRFSQSLRKPSEIVRNYFCQSFTDFESKAPLPAKTLPFAITNVNNNNIDSLIRMIGSGKN
ncbi:DUF5672 family protein [Dyadobacter psychrotolerans]|uniref:DUF5672 domain-containing protein n=1 Tax=Dyadobacter psychrotolerans TaxID=2541721 RepID=A0A4R5DWM5_9BACT|nr:DUF5672 family protein [Dyadobacter psychrotolerans]TDE16561.1 hypothetical protein E0F88_10010 [Dyadobacter psychrotolerans]